VVCEELSKFVYQTKKPNCNDLKDPSHINVHNVKMYGVIANTARTKGGNMLNEKFISYEHTSRTIKLQTCILAHLNLKTFSRG
jgi:hypothetical protein